MLKLIFILVISFSRLSWSENIVNRPDPARPAHQHHASEPASVLQHTNIVNIRGGDIHSAAAVSASDASSVESVIYKPGTDGTNADHLMVEPDSLKFDIIQPGDGSHSDPDGIPARFLMMHKGQRELANKAFLATKSWREKYKIDTILSRPHPNYDVYKAIFPVFLAGRDSTGHIIIVEQLGKIDDGLAKRKNISMDEVMLHFVFMVEYCWNILDKPPHKLPENMMHLLSSTSSSHMVRDAIYDGTPTSHGSMVTVMDCEGVTLSSLLGLGKAASENRKFLIKFVQTLSDNYPLRSYKTLIVNAPTWIHSIYFNLIRPLLRESSREKIRLFQGGKEQEEALIELGLFNNNCETESHDIQEGSRNGDFQLMARQSSMERELRNFALDILKRSGQVMNEVG